MINKPVLLHLLDIINITAIKNQWSSHQFLYGRPGRHTELFPFRYKLEKHFNGDLKGKRIAIWGLAFKPETDDMREAPSLVLIEKLLAAGCEVYAYDPVAVEESKRRIGDAIHYAKDIYDAVVDANALMLVTEWKEFRMPSWSAIKKLMATPLVLNGYRYDCRNRYLYVPYLHPHR